MITTVDTKYEANKLRKEGHYEEALPIYRELWEKSDDQYIAAGLLHCLRKLELFDDAIPLADNLFAREPELPWCHFEITWTYIQGIIEKADNNENLEKILNVAERVIKLNAGDIARKIVVLRVLKLASSSKQWDVINEWAPRINPESLSTDPKIIDGKTGWSDQAQWYNYRIKGLIHGSEQSEVKEAVVLAETAAERFPRQQKYFQRYKALANSISGDLPAAEIILQSLCKGDRPDWWLLHDYSKVISSQGRKDDALRIMYQAAKACPSHKLTVSLLEDIGVICLELEKHEEARAHLLLCKYIREKERWHVSESVISKIANINGIIGIEHEPSSLQDALVVCQNYWDVECNKTADSDEKKLRERKIRRGLIGSLILTPDDKPYCFLAIDGEQPIFCPKSELCNDIKNGAKVIFDARPSFDKKKNQESWKACNIKVVT